MDAVRLKFDIYFQVQQGTLTLYQLVPEKKRWSVKLDSHTESDVERLLGLLAAGVASKELEALLITMPSICSRITTFLRERHLFSDLDSIENQSNPFLRQLELFDSWNRTDRLPREFQELLSKATVMVIGAGGVGSALADLLTSSGVGRICCIDDDHVEIHNLARQSLYMRADVGHDKASVLSRRLGERCLNRVIPIVCRLTAESVDEVIERCGDVDIVTGFPLPSSVESRERLGRLLQYKMPYLCVGERDVGPFIRSLDEADKFHEHLYERFPLQHTWEDARTLRAGIGLHPSYAPDIAIIAGIAVDQIIRYLTGYAPLQVDKGVFSLDPITDEVRFYPIQTDLGRISSNDKDVS